MIGAVFTVGKFGYAAFSGQDALVDATAQFAVKLALSSKHADEATAEEIVEEAKSEAPRDTGLLESGITFEIDDEGFATVTSVALNEQGRDYARFVEFGTAHTAAQPFFYDVAREALERHNQTLEDAVAAAGNEEGFT